MVTISQKTSQEKSIHDKLVRVRMEMYELEESFGMIHELTVAKSQELDVVINEYMRGQVLGSIQFVS